MSIIIIIIIMKIHVSVSQHDVLIKVHFLDLFHIQAFNGFLSGKGPKRLLSELKKIDDFLESEDDTKFLVDNVLSFADCYLLPRLQHIRVAGKVSSAGGSCRGPISQGFS